MLSEKTRKFLKYALLIAGVFAFITSAYIGFAVAERYRALTAAYIVQSQELIQVLQRANGGANATEANAGEPGSESPDR